MVVNRGFHNPKRGSFSFFETVNGNGIELGEFVFGYITHRANGVVDLDQEPSAGKLLIEAIAWDAKRGIFNFYELIGCGFGAQWYYRGDSDDAIRDNTYLHRQSPIGRNKFGTIMRCSACHNSGGPIMKELASPHNDWWFSDRPLLLAPNRPSKIIERYPY